MNKLATKTHFWSYLKASYWASVLMSVWMNDLRACNLITDYFSYCQIVTKLSEFSGLHGSTHISVWLLSADEEDFVCSKKVKPALEVSET